MILEKVMLDIKNSKICISDNSEFNEMWNKYVYRFEVLAQKLNERNIDIKLLTDVIDAAKNVERLGIKEAYAIGYIAGHSKEMNYKSFYKSNRV